MAVLRWPLTIGLVDQHSICQPGVGILISSRTFSITDDTLLLCKLELNIGNETYNEFAKQVMNVIKSTIYHVMVTALQLERYSVTTDNIVNKIFPIYLSL